jgi:biofilm protein TabA
MEFAAAEGLLSLEPGKYPIDGDDVFALVQDVVTEPANRRRFELHRAYIDIQLVLAGRERQFYAPATGDLVLVEDALSDKDFAFCAPPSRSNALCLFPNDYAVYLPGEPHCPCCAVDAPEPVRKVVFKVRIAS